LCPLLSIIEILSTRLTRAERNERENNYVSDQLLKLAHFPLGKKKLEKISLFFTIVPHSSETSKSLLLPNQAQGGRDWWTFHNPKG